MRKKRPIRSRIEDLVTYSANEILSTQYYKFPKWLLKTEVKNDAKLLYMILRDRIDLSTKNKWVDENGNVYIIYTRDNVMNMLGIAKDKCSDLFNELKETGLIYEKRIGLNKPNLIYVRYPKSLYKRISEKSDSGDLNNSSQDEDKSNDNKTYYIKTDNNNVVVKKINRIICDFENTITSQFSLDENEEINMYIKEFAFLILDMEKDISQQFVKLDDYEACEILLEYLKIKFKDPTVLNIERPIGYIISLIRKKGGKI